MDVGKTLIWCAAAVALGGVRDAAAEACQIIVPGPLILDPVEQQQDTQAPATPQASVVSVLPGTGPPTCDGVAQPSSGCAEVGVITLAVTSSDDRTPALQLGYQVTVVRGQAPRGLTPIDQAMQALPDGTLILGYTEFGDQPRQVDFDLEVRAVDLAGNVSAGAALVTVQSPPPPPVACQSGFSIGDAVRKFQPPPPSDPGGGCRMSGRASDAAPLLTLLLLGCARLTRRRASRARR